MKVSKIFGCVLGLHLCIIAVLIIQPGCQTAQPPTQTYTQDRSTSGDSWSSSGAVADDMLPTEALDSAFNAGFEDDQFAPDGNLSDLDQIAPLVPIEPIDAAPSVDIAESSFETYTVKKGDSLWGIARKMNVSLKDLFEANGLNKNSVLRVGQLVQIPVEGNSVMVQSVTPDVYQPSGYNQSSKSYTVKRGDNLTKIAKQFGASVRAIKAANNKSSDVIRVGETLIIPVRDPVSNSQSAANSVVLPTLIETNAASSNPTNGIHIVKAGEYPSVIAKKYGMTTEELLSINSIADPRKIQIGQRLKLNGSGSSESLDSRLESVSGASTTSASGVSAISSPQPTEITVIEADPLIDGEFSGVEVIIEEPEVQPIEVVEEVEFGPFENAVEIPVIRLEE